MTPGNTARTQLIRWLRGRSRPWRFMLWLAAVSSGDESVRVRVDAHSAVLFDQRQHGGARTSCLRATVSSADRPCICFSETGAVSGTRTGAAGAGR